MTSKVKEVVVYPDAFHVQDFGPQLGKQVLERIAGGGSVVDPALVQELVTARKRSVPLAVVSERERDVLSLIAEGRSNRAIAKQLYLSTRAIERDVQAIFEKLDLPSTEDDNRRVLAVLALLGH